MTPSSPLVTHDSGVARDSYRSHEWIGGLGGLTFVASVLTQNAIRAGFPPNGAAAPKVIEYYGAHWASTLALAVLYPVGALGLVAFLSVTLSRLVGMGQRVSSIAGAFGAAGIVATYTMLVATDLGLAGYIRRGAADPAAVGAMWTLHTAVFGVLLTSIGLAVGGLGVACASAGQLPGWWKRLSLAGGLLLLSAAATAPAIIDGGPTIWIGLAGFAVWLGFVVSESVVLLRGKRELTASRVGIPSR
jgi:hypothetical protein